VESDGKGAYRLTFVTTMAQQLPRSWAHTAMVESRILSIDDNSKVHQSLHVHPNMLPVNTRSFGPSPFPTHHPPHARVLAHDNKEEWTSPLKNAKGAWGGWKWMGKKGDGGIPN